MSRYVAIHFIRAWIFQFWCNLGAIWLEVMDWE